MAADQLFDTDIPWGLPPAPVDIDPSLDLSAPDLLGMMTADLVATEAHLSSATADLASYRELVHVALDTVTELTALVRKQQARILDQSRQIRELMGLGPGSGW
jgi:hypothetical protein